MQVKHATAIVGALVALSGTARGQVDGGGDPIESNWAFGVSGLWSNDQAWDPVGSPNNFPPQQLFFNATIDRRSKLYQVLVDVDVELQNLTVDSPEATLNLGFANMQVNENFSLLSGTLTRPPAKKDIEMVVDGVLRLSDGALMGAGTIVSNGSIIFGLGGGEGQNRNVDICNTGVDHRGTGTIRMDGGTDVQFNQGGSLDNNSDATISIGETGPVTIEGDGTGSINNDGDLVNIGGTTLIEGGGLEVTSITGVNFFNNGTVTVLASELRLDTPNDLAEKGVLNNGVWNVNFGNLNFVETSIWALGTEVNIFGSESQFNSINFLLEIFSEGKFQIGQGKDFVVVDFLYNGGEIKVGRTSTFDATSGLDNLKGNALFGGKFVVAGSFLSGAESLSGITFLGSDLTLDGPDSIFTGIESLNQIGNGGRFALENGRTFTTISDLSVNNGGILRVGAGSSLTVKGELNNNDPGGLFRDGIFDIEGTFAADNLNIIEISNEIILDGPNSLLLNGLGQDALSALERITETGILRLRNGRTIENIDDLIVDGILCIDGNPVVNRGALPGSVLTTSATFGPTSTLDFIVNGPQPDNHGKLFVDTQLDVTPGARIRVMMGENAQLSVGDEVTLVAAGLMAGTFAVIEGADPNGDLGFEITQDAQGVTAKVVSTSCPVDLEPDGVLNFFDVAAFIDAFLNQLPAGDFNNDGLYNFFDVSAFVVAFGRGCP